MLTHDLLSRAKIEAGICPSVNGLCSEIENGCAAVILTEEVFEQPDFARLSLTLADQPAWSDVASAARNRIASSSQLRRS